MTKNTLCVSLILPSPRIYDPYKLLFDYHFQLRLSWHQYKRLPHKRLY